MSKFHLINLVAFVCFVIFVVQTKSKESGHEQPFGSKGPFLEIDKTESISTKDFFENYVQIRKPILLKNGAKKFPAVNLWNDDYLLKKAKGLDDFLFNVETAKKEERNRQMIEMSFEEFISNYRSKDYYLVTDLADFFMSDLYLPQPLQCEHASKGVDKMVMWFSSGDTKSVIHTDDYENILCVIDGVKDLILVDSYKHPAEEILINRHDGAFSSADVDKVDYTKFLGIENLEYYKASLVKGDCIYIPYRWVHQVRSYKRNIGVNFWFNNEKLFEYGEFSDVCKKNEFDDSKTLDQIEIDVYDESSDENSDDAGQFRNFKFWLIRKVNDGNRQIKDWIAILVEEHLPKNKNIKDYPVLNDQIGEFFYTLDYDGDGRISNDELRQIDMNRLEHMAHIIEDLDQEMTNIQKQKSKKKKKTKENKEEL